MSPALSNGICVRAIGLPVWAIHDKFVFFFCPHGFCSRLQGTVLRYRDEIVQAHCSRGGIVTSKKFWGSDPQGGNFSQIFFRDFDLKN